MRKLALSVALVCAAPLLAFACADDRDHEAADGPTDSEAEPTPLSGWFLSGPAQQHYRLDTDRAVKLDGAASGRLTATTDSPIGAGVVTQSVPADPWRGKRVRFSASVRTENVTRWTGLWMKVDRPDARDAFDNMQTRPLGGTREWERHAVVLDVPDDARSLQFGMLQDGSGTSWIDDAKLEVVGEDVAVTDLDDRRDAPLDTDFEAPRPSDAWLLTGVARDDFKLERSTERPRSGSSSLLLVNAVERPRGYAAIEQGVRADTYRGKRIRFSAWLRGEAVELGAGLSVMVLGADAPPMSPGLTGAQNGSRGTFDWERFDVVLDIPSDADTILLGVGMRSPGKLWVDDYVLEEVGRDIPVSDVDERPARPQNGSLEDGKDAPLGWFISGGARSHYRAVIDSAVKHGGASSARFEPSVAEPQGYGTLMQHFKADDYRDKRVRMTAFVRGKGVDERGDVWLRVQARESPGDGPGLGGGGCQLSGDFDWKPCTIVFDVPKRGHGIDVGIGTTGHGTIWLDDVTFEEVGLDVPLTHDRSEPRAVLNGAFDADAAIPRGWFVSGGGRQAFEAVVEAGAARLRVKPGATANGYGALMQSVQARDFIGKRMRARVRVRGENITSGDVWVRVQSATSPGDGPGLGGGSCPLSGTFSWQPCEVVLDVPERGASIQIGAGIRGDGAGTLFIDDVTLDEVDRGVALTGRVLDGREPVNLGFEP